MKQIQPIQIWDKGQNKEADILNKAGVYVLFWKDFGHFYIGSSKSVLKRYNKHRYLMTHGINKNGDIQKYYNINGYPNIAVLKYCQECDILNKEQYYLNLYFEDHKCLNFNKNAYSSKGYKYSEENKAKMSAARKPFILSGKDSPNYGRKASLESKLKMSEAQKGAKSIKAKLVFDTYTGVYYDCLIDLTNLYNLNHRNMSRYLSGSRKNKTQFIYA
jgi:group I intron endonuclease